MSLNKAINNVHATFAFSTLPHIAAIAELLAHHTGILLPVLLFLIRFCKMELASTYAEQSIHSKPCRVICRVRPMMSSDALTAATSSSSILEIPSPDTVILAPDRTERIVYDFDRVIGPSEVCCGFTASLCTHLCSLHLETKSLQLMLQNGHFSKLRCRIEG